MSQFYVVKNQHGLFADKHKEWVDGREPKLLFKSQYKDEAINLVFELSSKDIAIRAEAISVELDDNRYPVVEVTAPPPAPESKEPATTGSEEAVQQDAPSGEGEDTEPSHGDAPAQQQAEEANEPVS